ncbi:hypothetical protein KIW84_064654 [Lathyrus oleraceus]|uniref:Uncharacterized protein n=1 Tax=Pisum sativum TaxID=3888 RepID=A0A9D5ABD1_PEA|nr:hypothetical protein KIW84_064654 [Pisum sativum]
MIDVHRISLQITPTPSASPPKISPRSLPNGYAPQPSGAMINPSASIDVPSPTPLEGPASPSSSHGVKYDFDMAFLIGISSYKPDKSNSFSTKDQHKPHERNVHNQEAFSTNQLLYNPSNIWNSNNY